MNKLFKTLTIVVTMLTFTVKTQAQDDFDLAKAAGKWAFEDVSYNLAGRIVNDEPFPPSEQAMAKWQGLNDQKTMMLDELKKMKYVVEIKKTNAGDVLVESYNSDVFGAREVVYFTEFTPGGVYFTNASVLKFSGYLIPKLSGDKLEITTAEDPDGLFMVFTFKHAK